MIYTQPIIHTMQPNTILMHLIHEQKMMQESFRSPVVEPPFDYKRLQHMKLQNKYNITDVAPLATQGFLLATEESVLKIIKGEIFHVHSFKAGVDFIGQSRKQ